MSMVKQQLNYHLWIPELFRFKGGIQVFSDFFIQALQSINSKIECSIFLKHDVKVSTEINYLNNTKFYFAGISPKAFRTVTFAFQILCYGLYQYPDLVITTHLNFTVAAYWLKKISGIPYITIAHGVEAWNIKKPNLIKALHSADKILAVSEYTRSRLINEQNISPEKIEILSNTFDHNRFKIAPKPNNLLEKYNLNLNHKIILTVSRLSSGDGCYKGYDKIIAALPQILQKIPNAHYILVGKGGDRPRIEQLIKKLNLNNHVTLAGFIPDEQLGDYYNLCDIFAMPSKKEGFGIVFLEALACGKPILGGNQDGTVDALLNGEVGVLVDPDNVDEIANTITRILQGSYFHPLIYQPEKLRQKVIDNFCFEKFQATLAKHLEEILK